MSQNMLENIPKKFELPKSDNPLVSIVIPVYNQYSYTHACVYSIFKFTPSFIPYEVIILDDCSTDETKIIKEEIKNIIVYRNQTNQGFLKNCNLYIPQARGKYIFLLNNDTEVTPGYIEPLLKTIREVGVGLVGSCVLNTNGTIQSAGWSLFKDATPYPNYAGLSPNYLKNKKMDIFSAAGCSIFFEKNTWKKLGGFDETYMPAYYEDTDFSMRIRYQLKKRVVCVADSRIFHYGSISYQGKTCSLSYANQTKFCDRWKKQLEEFNLDKNNFVQYLDNLWRWDTIRIFGFPILKSYYKSGRKIYYFGKIKLFSKPFVYED